MRKPWTIYFDTELKGRLVAERPDDTSKFLEEIVSDWFSRKVSTPKENVESLEDKKAHALTALASVRIGAPIFKPSGEL